MVKSMTGFGRAEVTEDGIKITVEMKSVNHRYSELTVRLPRQLNYFEASVRSVVKKYVNRGKVDLTVTYVNENEGEGTVRYNRQVSGQYVNYMREMAGEFGLSPDISVNALARLEGVFTSETAGMDEERILPVLEKAVTQACEKFCRTREAEGEHLKNDIFGKLDGMLEWITLIEQRSPEIVSEYRRKITDKVNELLGDTKLDETTLATEVILFADKICVDEETVRLRAHIKNLRDTLNEAENVGRKLDFIAQEMNREANTILSKANDLTVSNTAIDLKTEIEKIREQIQNIE